MRYMPRSAYFLPLATVYLAGGQIAIKQNGKYTFAIQHAHFLATSLYKT